MVRLSTKSTFLDHIKLNSIASSHFIVKFRCQNTAGRTSQDDSRDQEKGYNDRGTDTHSGRRKKDNGRADHGNRYAQKAPDNLREPSRPAVPRQRACAAEEDTFCKGAKPSEQAEDKSVWIPGRKPGHASVSHHRRSKEAVHHRPDKCNKCGGASISDVRITTKQIIDIPQMPEATVVTHVCHKCVCSDCKTVTVPKPPRIKGASLGPNLLAFLTSVWGKAVSVGNATTLLNDTFVAGLCKTAVTHALVAASGRLQKTADEINGSLSESQYLKMDETPIRFNGKRQYVWACIGDEGVAVTVGTRSAAEIDCHFPYYDKPITCDGYPAYNVFHTRQRCWAHILRESEFIMYDKKTNPTAAMLHHKLQELYHEAKLEPPDISDAHHMELVCRARSVAKAYVRS